MALAGLQALLLAGAWESARAGTIRVSIQVPAPARIDMEGIDTVLVTRFIVDRDVAGFDLNREVVALLRRDLRKGTDLEVLIDEPPSLPEQPLQDLLANTGFWRRLAEAHGADLVIAGKTGFSVSDRSGFVQRDEISALTGQRVRRTLYQDREAFTLDLDLFFVRGSTGQLLYEDRFTGEETFNGLGNDRLAGLFTLFEEIEGSILGIVNSRKSTVQRTLFAE